MTSLSCNFGIKYIYRVLYSQRIPITLRCNAAKLVAVLYTYYASPVLVVIATNSNCDYAVNIQEISTAHVL